MSDLTVSLSATGFIGLESEKTATATTNKTEKVENKDAEKTVDITAANANKDLKPAEVEVAVQEINAFMQSMQRNLSFTIDEQLGQEIISVTDAETHEMIRQIPSEELVVLRKKMDDVVGILFDTKV
jgi:flagellar protein FlaG